MKDYVDKVAMHFGQGSHTHVISCQSEFNAVFNKGMIEANTTIILLPANHAEQGYRHYEQPNYVLNNQVTLKSGVSIIGYNPSNTVISKKHADCRFVLEGKSGLPIQDVRLSGFTFEGQVQGQSAVCSGRVGLSI